MFQKTFGDGGEGRANGDPDFFAGLPMQTAQRILKEAVSTFKGWLSALKEYKKAPDSWFSHLAVEVQGEETSTEWLEAVE